MKYEGPNSYQSKDMVNVKVFVDRRTDGPKIICSDLSMREHKSDKLLVRCNFTFYINVLESIGPISAYTLYRRLLIVLHSSIDLMLSAARRIKSVPM